MAPIARSGPALADATVVFVLGGPGAGKGTQCARLVRDYPLVHLSAGDLLRAEETRPGSVYGELIRTHIADGRIVPKEVTIALLKHAMCDAMQRSPRCTAFLIDGFPRQLDQFVQFEADVCPADFSLYFECPDEVLLERLLRRGKTSGRDDDNMDSIRKRFHTFHETSLPVICQLQRANRCVAVDCQGSEDEVYRRVRQIFDTKLPGMFPREHADTTPHVALGHA